MPKHPHADLIMAYAKLAQKTDKPWEYFQYWDYADDDWKNVSKWRLLWIDDIEYRLKPSTIKIGEYDVPEPIRIPLETPTTYYYPSTEKTLSCMSRFWRGDFYDYYLLRCGLIHLDENSAILHAKALISLTSLTQK
ncbi:hypothetical protein [Xenorhabdus kozodoii]|uniref:Uncharacterized protein n=1 Tax=Xenorhabdus kozodoii TaxID=351676 RepID=A0A2D0KZI1_9GAMM|nr:hypothetical protein [Xenorhabdus kozodoii]PHM68849.1 hypothetical protein Xkoz_03617 [Xenorhabdus kozodoii]